MTPTQSLLVVIFAPLLSAVIIAFFCRQRHGLAAAISVAAAGAIFVFSLLAIMTVGTDEVHASSAWLHFGDFEVNKGFLFDDVATDRFAKRWVRDRVAQPCRATRDDAAPF